MAERSDAPLADEPQPGAVPNDMPTGLPAQETESEPMGPSDAQPEGEGEPQRGEDAMPGIPGGREGPTAG